jgi:hypothetical protein
VIVSWQRGFSLQSAFLKNELVAEKAKNFHAKPQSR